MSSEATTPQALTETLRHLALRCRRGAPATCRELGLELGLSAAGTHHRLQRLRDAGLLTWESRSPRSARPTPAGWAALGLPATAEAQERDRVLAYLGALEGTYSQAGDEAAADALAAAAEAIAQHHHRRSA